MTLFDVLAGLFAIAIIVFTGLQILRWTSSPAWASGWPARLALGHLVGSGAMAWIVTVAGLISGRLSILPFYTALIVLVAATFMRRHHLMRQPEALHHDSGSATEDTFGSAWRVLAISATALGIIACGWGLVSDPHLTMDAHWNWALKAKALIFDGSFNTIAQNCCTHPNYPVLFPLQSWWIYKHVHHVSAWWPEAVGYLFYLDLLALTFAVCREHMSSTWAWITTGIVANDVVEVLNSAHGQPDSAVAAYLLASSILLASYFARRDAGSRWIAILLLVGVLQTKNEGLAWAAFATTLLVVFELRAGMYRRAAGSAACFLAALAPWTIFKHIHAMRNGPEETLATLHILRVEWLFRIKVILLAHIRSFVPYSLVFLLVLCVPLMWRGWKKVSKPVLGLIAAQLAAYFVIYFVVADQVYQLSFMMRGISHFSPALICICMIAYQTRNEPTPSPANFPST